MKEHPQEQMCEIVSGSVLDSVLFSYSIYYFEYTIKLGENLDGNASLGQTGTKGI